MKRVLGLPLVFLLFAGIATVAHAAMTEVITYDGFAVDEHKNPVIGPHDLELCYYAHGNTKPLYCEQFKAVPIKDGHFQVILGQGQVRSDTASADLNNVFAQYPELSLEFTIGGTLQHPRIGILPAGHSGETRAMLAGAISKDNEAHTKGYRVKNTRTAIQAVNLAPAGSASGDPYSLTHKSNPFLVDMDFLGVSDPLRDMPIYEASRASKGEAEGREINTVRHEDIFDEDGIRYGTRTKKTDDPLAAESQRGSGRATPGLLVDFEGIGNVNGVAPPDPEGAVGPNHYIQVVNLSFAIFDKTGAEVQSPRNTNTLWSGFGGACQNDNDGDAIFLYDEHADRWILTQFAVNSGQAVCFAVSTTGDPTGSYYLYQLTTQRFPDYYKLGVWPDALNNAYFMGTNTGNAAQYDVYAIDRASLLAGVQPNSAQYFQNHPNLLMPADLDGDNLPPSGTPGIFYTFRDGGESYFNPSSPVDTIDIWEFDVDWAAPASSTFDLVQGIVPPELADFNWTVCGFFNQACLPQPGTGVTIDSASWWPMQRLQYRNLGRYETLASSWTVDVLADGDHAAPRWFELRRTTGAWSIAHQGTFAPDSKHRWMPSAALDGSGNMAMGYSVVEASSVTYPGLRYATRAAGATDFDAEATQIAGSGAETGASRWGDYASMEVDPSDDCTFWFTSEYMATSGSFNWQTRVGAFVVPGCTGHAGLGVTPLTRGVCSSAGSTTFGVSLVSPFDGTTNLSVSGCPSGASCSFSPNPVIYPVETSALTVSGLAGVSQDAYTIAVTATDSVTSATTMTVDVDLTVYAGNAVAPTLTSPADGATGVSMTPTLSWVAGADAIFYDLEVATDVGFSNIVESESALTGTSHTLTGPLSTNTQYHWRMNAVNPCGPSAWSAALSFTTTNPTPVDPTCSVPGVAIPDYDSGGVDDTVTITDTGILADLNLGLEITHTWIGDLKITLTHEASGTSVVLIDESSCSSNDISVTLDDEAVNSVVGECEAGPAIFGTFRPANPLSGFDGLELSGSWTLNVADNTSSDTGTLDAWCLFPSIEGGATGEIFSDGFESSNTSAWSATHP